MQHKIEIRYLFNGKVKIHLDSNGNEIIDSSKSEICDIFLYRLGKRIADAFADSVTIFHITPKQLVTLKQHLKNYHRDLLSR